MTHDPLFKMMKSTIFQRVYIICFLWNASLSQERVDPFPTKKTHCVDFKLISWQCWKNAAALVSFTAFRKKIYRGRGWIFGFRFSPYQASVCSTCPPMTTQIHFHTVGKPWLRRTGWGLMEKRGFNNVGETLSSRRFLWPVRWVNYDFLNLTTTQPESYGIRWHLI